MYSGQLRPGNPPGPELAEYLGRERTVMRVSGLCLAAILAVVLIPAGAGAEPFSFFVAGDTRSNPDIFQRNVESMVELDSSAIALFNSGDITSDGRESQWDDHLQALADGAPDPDVPADRSGLVRQSVVRTDVSDWGNYIRYVGAVGNHDTHESGWIDVWNAYLPGQKDLGHNSSRGVYFTLVYHNTLFIILDSENPSSAQTEWLAEVLQGPQAQAATWKFAFFHHPIYPCNYKSPFDEGVEWAELFEQHGVDIAFVAHSHTYERTCPMIGGECADGGVVYLNSSGGGAGVRDVDDDKSDTVSSGDRSDDYRCSDILEKARGNWHHFCHAAIAEGELTVKCYSHDDPSSPWDQMTMSKGVVEQDGGIPQADGGNTSDAGTVTDAGTSQDPDEDKQPDPVGCQCSEDLQPVCGSDGETYQNRCQLSCAGVSFVHEGECLVLGCGCNTGAGGGALLLLVLIPLFLTRRWWLVIFEHGDES
jgi:hypothetical protein